MLSRRGDYNYRSTVLLLPLLLLQAYSALLKHGIGRALLADKWLTIL